MTYEPIENPDTSIAKMKINQNRTEQLRFHPHPSLFP